MGKVQNMDPSVDLVHGPPPPPPIMDRVHGPPIFAIPKITDVNNDKIKIKKLKKKKMNSQ